MTWGSPLPPGGFQWGGPPPKPPRRRPLRWWWIAAAVLVVAALVAGGVLAVRFWTHDESPAATAAEPAAITGTPPDLLVGFSLARQPVPAWQLTDTDIGLPPAEAPGSAVQIGSPFGTSGENAYFMASRGEFNCGRCVNGINWLYGIDTTTGKTLFAPVQFPTGNVVDCHMNGPDAALCTNTTVHDGPHLDVLPPPMVWIVDLHGGKVTFTGPTTLNYPTGPNMDPKDNPPGPTLVDVGVGPSRVIATVRDKGVYGIGSHGEFTWFAPGTGDVDDNTGETTDVPAFTRYIQHNGPPTDLDHPDNRVYSVLDGKDLTPSPPENSRLTNVRIYNGGFAYEFDDENGNAAGVSLYDDDGKLVRTERNRERLQSDDAMPVLLHGSTLAVYQADGPIIANIPIADIVSKTRIIGPKIYVYQGGYAWDTAQWQQYDLRTSQPGATCQMQLDVSYVASDGTVIVTNRKDQMAAIDAKTCQTLWTTPSGNGVTKVGHNLIQRTPDGNAWTGLRAPE